MPELAGAGRIAVSKAALTRLVDLLTECQFVRESERAKVLHAVREILPDPRLEARYILALSKQHRSLSTAQALADNGVAQLQPAIQAEIFDLARVTIGANEAGELLAQLDLQDLGLASLVAKRLDACSRDDLRAIANQISEAGATSLVEDQVIPRMEEAAAAQLLRSELRLSVPRPEAPPLLRSLTPQVRHDPLATLDYVPPADLGAGDSPLTCDLCGREKIPGMDCNECGHVMCLECLEESPEWQNQVHAGPPRCPECGGVSAR